MDNKGRSKMKACAIPTLVVLGFWACSIRHLLSPQISAEKLPREVGVFASDALGIRLLSMDLEVERVPGSKLHADRFQRNCSCALYDYEGFQNLAATPGYNAKAFLVYNSRLALLKVSKSASTTVYGYLTQYGQRINDPFRLEYVDLGQDYESFAHRFANHTFFTTMREPCQRVGSAFSTLVHRDTALQVGQYAKAVDTFRSGKIKHYHHLLPQSWFYYGVNKPMYVFEVDSGLTSRVNRFLNRFFATNVPLQPAVKNRDEGRQGGNHFCDYLKDSGLYANYYADELLYAEFRRHKVETDYFKSFNSL